MFDEATPVALPAGEYAIVECLGHRTLVGRMSEVERFGTKMLSLEPLFRGELLPAVLIGGSSLYALTPCSAEVAARRAPTEDWELPTSLRATLPLPALPAPEEGDAAAGVEWCRCENVYGDNPACEQHARLEDEDGPIFAPAFLNNGGDGGSL